MPLEGIEPPTQNFRGFRSTTELQGLVMTNLIGVNFTAVLYLVFPLYQELILGRVGTKLRNHEAN